MPGQFYFIIACDRLSVADHYNHLRALVKGEDSWLARGSL
jgi:hypothetical protein